MTQDEFKRYEKAAEIKIQIQEIDFYIRKLKSLVNFSSITLEDETNQRKVYINNDSHMIREVRDACVVYLEDKLNQLEKAFEAI